MTTDETNTLKIGIRELNALLNHIDSDQPEDANPNRDFVRWKFRIVRVHLTVEHTSGSKVVLPVATRNISRGGISILHSSFVYPNSRCHIAAELDDGRVLDIAGIVKRCNHIGGTVHEIGIKFNEEISTKELLGLDPMQEAYSLESIDPNGLQGNILIICAAELDRILFTKLLEETSLTIAAAQDTQAALKRAQRGCDLILIDFNVGSESASDILLEFRAQGIDAPALVMTSDPSLEIRDELQMAGASGLLIKPFTQHKLFQALAEFLLGDGDSGPIYTSLTQDDPAIEILGKFLTELPRLILTLEKTLRESDRDACLAICRSLASSASPLGFEHIGQLAVQADQSLTKNPSTREAAPDVRRLIIACRRIKARPKKAA